VCTSLLAVCVYLFVGGVCVCTSVLVVCVCVPLCWRCVCVCVPLCWWCVCTSVLAVCVCVCVPLCGHCAGCRAAGRSPGTRGESPPYSPGSAGTSYRTSSAGRTASRTRTGSPGGGEGEVSRGRSLGEDMASARSHRSGGEVVPLARRVGPRGSGRRRGVGRRRAGRLAGRL